MEFPKAILKSMEDNGPEETASMMGRALAYLAHTVGNDIEFECDIGTVTVKRTQPEQNA